VHGYVHWCRSPGERYGNREPRRNKDDSHIANDGIMLHWRGFTTRLLSKMIARHATASTCLFTKVVDRQGSLLVPIVDGAV
jgi:hypothetical protein